MCLCISSIITLSPILCIEKFIVMVTHLMLSYLRKYSFLGSYNPHTVISFNKCLSVCMFLSFCGSKAREKTTGPTLFKFSQNLYFMPG